MQIRPEKIPKGCKINSPVYDHYKHGWHTPNQSRIGDCIPTYTNPSPSHNVDRIGSLEDAIKQSIIYMNHRISEATKLRAQMENLLDQI